MINCFVIKEKEQKTSSCCTFITKKHFGEDFQFIGWLFKNKKLEIFTKLSFYTVVVVVVVVVVVYSLSSMRNYSSTARCIYCHSHTLTRPDRGIDPHTTHHCTGRRSNTP
jgi:hypothetical protein